MPKVTEYYTHTHARTHACTHTRTHAHTHQEDLYMIEHTCIASIITNFLSEHKIESLLHSLGIGKTDGED